jgi:hypothetical protein
MLTKGLAEAVLKNGGLYFGLALEGSPDPRQDSAMSYSKTYNYTLYEMYPDRQLNTSRFIFNPGNKQLYEYDPVHDQLTAINYAKNLLLQLDTGCSCFSKTVAFK